jgi:hypothetical protein
MNYGLAPVAHACNPNYLGGRDQEEHGPKPDQVKSSWDPISKILNTKNGGLQNGSSSKNTCLAHVKS